MTPPTPPASWPTSVDYETLRASLVELGAEADRLRETVLDLDDDVEQARRIACALEQENAVLLASHPTCPACRHPGRWRHEPVHAGEPS